MPAAAACPSSLIDGVHAEAVVPETETERDDRSGDEVDRLPVGDRCVRRVRDQPGDQGRHEDDRSSEEGGRRGVELARFRVVEVPDGPRHPGPEWRQGERQDERDTEC